MKSNMDNVGLLQPQPKQQESARPQGSVVRPTPCRRVNGIKAIQVVHELEACWVVVSKKPGL